MKDSPRALTLESRRIHAGVSMKLPRPFYRLPLSLDVERLKAEVRALPEDTWVSRPRAIPDKWRRNEAAILGQLPKIQGVWDAL